MRLPADHPAVFGRVDGHISVANSAAFRKLASRKTLPIHPAEKSIAMRAANPPASCAKKPEMRSIK